MIAGWFSGLVLSVCCQILRFARVSQCSLSLLVASLPCPDSGFGPEWVPRCQLWYNSNITWSPSVWRSKWHGTWLLTWLATLHGVYVHHMVIIEVIILTWLQSWSMVWGMGTANVIERSCAKIIRLKCNLLMGTIISLLRGKIDLNSHSLLQNEDPL